MICCCVVLAWQPGEAQAKGTALDRTERKVVKLVNRIRARHGLRRVRASATLARAANDHTWDIMRTNVLSHASSDGTPMGTRVRRYTGADWVGENVAAVWGRRSTARKVVRMWMASPSHRAVLLSASGRPRRGGPQRRHHGGRAARRLHRGLRLSSLSRAAAGV